MEVVLGPVFGMSVETCSRGVGFCVAMLVENARRCWRVWFNRWCSLFAPLVQTASRNEWGG